MTNAVNIAQSGSNNVTFRNRIINGNMVIDQRNAGASVTLSTTTQYPVDRFPAYKGTSGATVTAQRSTTRQQDLSTALFLQPLLEQLRLLETLTEYGKPLKASTLPISDGELPTLNP